MHTTARELVRPLIAATALTTALTSGLITGLVALTPPAQAAGRQVPRSFFGLHDASQQAYGRLAFGSIRLWDSGTTWKDLETSPGTYDWSRLDSFVANARAHHVKVMLVLGMTPSFYGPTPTQAPSDLSHYRAYVQAVMRRYRSFQGARGIESYEVWNEGNVSAFWTGTPHRLALLTRIVGQVRNRVDPGATVVAPSFAIRLPGQRRWISSYQRQRVAGRPVRHWYDVNGLSLYPRERYGERTGGPEDSMALLGQVRRRLAAAGVPRRTPIWGTEVNYGLPPGGPGQQAARAISTRRQVANVLRTYLLGAARGLSRVYWYRYDWGRIAGGGPLGNTLLSDPDDPGRVTPAGRAVDLAQRWLDGRLVATGGADRPCARGRHGTYTCTVRHGHRVRTIMWNPHRRVRVLMPRSGARVRADDRVVRVGYRPVVVDRRR
jgi:hypothetical protein